MAGALVQEARVVPVQAAGPVVVLVAQAPEPAGPVEVRALVVPEVVLAAEARVPAEARALAPQAQVQVALQARPELVQEHLAARAQRVQARAMLRGQVQPAPVPQVQASEQPTPAVVLEGQQRVAAPPRLGRWP